MENIEDVETTGEMEVLSEMDMLNDVATFFKSFVSIKMVVITLVITIFYNPEMYKLTGSVLKKAPLIKMSKEMYLFIVHTFLVTLILGIFFYFMDSYSTEEESEEVPPPTEEELQEAQEQAEIDAATAEFEQQDVSDPALTDNESEVDSEAGSDAGTDAESVAESDDESIPDSEAGDPQQPQQLAQQPQQLAQQPQQKQQLAQKQP
tara:strand:+ start:496 stop:1113 length:618 start_codon:yes stop_codon:yes gene_type:complete